LVIQFHVSLFGQNVQDVSIAIYPKESFLKINSNILKIADHSTPFAVELAPGIYPIEIWASRFELFRDTIIVGEKPTSYSKVLNIRSSSFTEYKKALNDYNLERVKRPAISVGLIAVHAGALY